MTPLLAGWLAFVVTPALTVLFILATQPKDHPMTTETDNPRHEIGYALNENGHADLNDQIRTVIRYGDHSPEGYGSLELAAIVQLNDGTFLAVEAGCDTTGWDCQSEAVVSRHHAADDAWWHGITEDGRGLITRSESTEESTR